MNNQRAFEKWLADKGIAANYAGDGQYGSPSAQLAWEAWCEASEKARVMLALRDAEPEAIGAADRRRRDGCECMRSTKAAIEAESKL